MAQVPGKVSCKSVIFTVGQLGAILHVLSYKHSYYTLIGSSHACSGGQSHFGFVFVDGLCQSKAVLVSHPKTNHTTVSHYRHCDGEMVQYTNGHLDLITRLLSLSKVKALLRACYTMHL